MTNTIKLQKFLSSAGITSRRKAEELISKGQVQVNGQIASIGLRVDPEHDEIKINNKLIKNKAEKKYFLIYKPAGYVSTSNDELGRKTVLDLLPKTKERLFPVGRLDLESEGLMLITNDGTLTQKLTHPKFQIKKTYEVLLRGIPSTKALDHLKRGVKLKDGWAKPLDVEILGRENGNTWLEITIDEGRNRQVRRMMDRIGYDVIKLVRTQMGPFNLKMLDNKRFLEIQESEVSSLFK